MVDEYHLKVQSVLLQHAKTFEDFDFEDVLRDMQYVFAPNEVEAIRALESCAEQNEQLFFYLTIDPYKVNEFIQAIKEKYKWLADSMLRSLQDESNQDELKTIQLRIRELHSHMPRLTDYNVHRMKYLFAIEKALKRLEPMQCLILIGNLQFGKKWLAIDACSNYQVMRAMGTNVFYINLSNCHTKEAILEQMVLLFSLVAPPNQTLPPSYDESITNKIVLLKPVLIEHLRKIPDCLLILSSVPTVEALDAFRLKCKIMLTTRNKELQDSWSMSERIVFDIEHGLTPEQSRQLFAKVLKIRPNELPPEAIEIDALCYGNPCLIWIVASNLQRQSYEQKSMPWRKWVAALRQNESTCNDSFRFVIEQSLNSLTPGDLDLFHRLAVFDENAKIPLSLLHLYWGLSEAEVEKRVNGFDKLYLVDIVKQKSTFCTLQYHYWSYLSHTSNLRRKRELHKKLIECYKIDIALSTRTDISLSLPDDSYFYFYIARHIREAQMVHLLPSLYLDFGFLEQKLRATGLPNTIGDLQTYRTEIIADSSSRQLLLDELLDFLPNVEEMLKTSKDTCLLQYAMLTRGILSKEAHRQASKFRHRFFFEGSDHIYNHRQIVALPIRPVFIRFCAANFALIAFVDNSIWLVDLSTGYTVSPTWFDGHKDTVCDIQMLSDDYFVSLDRKGICLVWSLQNTQISRKRASSNNGQHLPNNASGMRNGIRQSRAESFNRHRKNPNKPVQRIERQGCSIQCFTLIRGLDGKTVENVIFGTESDQILIYTWGMNQLTRFHHEKTKVGPIHSIVPVRRNILIILSKAGILSRMNIKDMSVERLDKIPLTEKIEPVVGLHELSDQTYSSAAANSNCSVLVVYANQVFCVTLSQHLNLQEAHELYKPPLDCRQIICSVLSSDRKYLILGTERGIVVYDLNGLRLEPLILRRSVNDIVTCVDIYSLNSKLYRYVLMCGTQMYERFSYVYGLETDGHSPLMQWSPDRMDDGQHNTWLLGGRLFAVTDVDTNDFWFAGVDSRGDIHRKSSNDDFKQSMRIQCGNGSSKIQVFAAGGDNVFVGCNDGSVYDSCGNKLMQLQGPVTFLRYFHEGLMLVGSRDTYRIRMSGGVVDVPSRELSEAYILGDGRFVLMVMVDATFTIYDLALKKPVQSELDAFEDEVVGGCHLLDDRFAMASRKELHFWTIAQSDEHCRLVPWNNHNAILLNVSEPAVCVRLSAKSEFCAVGFSNGLIQLFRLDQHCPQLFHQLHSHAAKIHALLFSPWTSDNRKPVILISVSEQICFWNVTFAINNQTVNDQNDRHSDRFPDRSPIFPSIKDKLQFFGANEMQCTSPWIGKLGPTAKQELLACYKFNGNTAQQLFANPPFTRFLTIDDVGEIYFLKVSDSENKYKSESDDVIVELETINMQDDL